MPKITIKGRKLHYLDQGKGYPIVFGHSYLWDSHMWRPQVEKLSTHFRCIVPDLWCHGQSSDASLEGTYPISAMADDYYELINALEIDRFSMIGLSVGGMIGVELALKYPDALDSLAIMGSYVGSEPEITQKRYLAFMAQAEENKKFTSELAEAITPLFFSPSTYKTDPDLIKSFNIHLRSIPEDRIKGVTNIGRGIFTRPDRLKDLNRITIPTLVLVGEDDIPRPPKEAHEMADLLPHSSLVILSQAGHISNLEHPEEVTREIEKLVRSAILHKEPLKKVS